MVHRGRGSRAWNDVAVEVDTEAVVKLWVGDERLVGIGEGNGPVNAIDTALARVCSTRFPSSSDLSSPTTRCACSTPRRAPARSPACCSTRTNGDRSWTTIGVSENIIEASWQALIDSLVYGLLLAER